LSSCYKIVPFYKTSSKRSTKRIAGGSRINWSDPWRWYDHSVITGYYHSPLCAKSNNF
jgi:hypothetical protein